MKLDSTLHIKIDAKTLEKAKAKAAEHGISASAWVRIMLTNQLEDPRPVVLKEALVAPKKRRAS